MFRQTDQYRLVSAKHLHFLYRLHVANINLNITEGTERNWRIIEFLTKHVEDCRPCTS